MNRIATTILLALAAAFLLSCGGGSSTPADNLTPGDNANPVITPEAPSEVIGSHTTSVVPDQVNVLTGADPAELSAQLAKFDMSCAGKNGGWATVDLPAGTDLDWAVDTLRKEFNIAKAEKINVLHTVRTEYDLPTIETEKGTSFAPMDPMYAGRHQNMGSDGTNWSIGSYYYGQAPCLDGMNWQAAWDVAMNANIAANEVRIAVIGAGFWDFSVVNWQTFNENRLDADTSGSIAGDGTVTTGLASAAWEIYDNGDAATPNEPYDMQASLMLGAMADDLGDPQFATGWFPRYYDLNGDETPTSDEFWSEGIAGCSPWSTFILVKTGSASGDTWAYTDNEIAAAINYAAGDPGDTNGGLWPNGGCGADIILLGMFANGPVGANVSTAIQTARDNNALVIAPAGDVSQTWDNNADPPVFTETPVDITVDSVTPASDPNCIAAVATGYNRVPELGTITMNEVEYENFELGWDARFGTPFSYSNIEIATDYANVGGDIAAGGSGIGWGVSPIFTTGDPAERQIGYNFAQTYNRFGSCYSAAYVASAAAIVHQALNFVNGAEPSDDDVWTIITDTMNYAPMTGLANNGGMLDAGRAAYHAMEGGTLFQPSMYFTGLTISQPPAELEPGVGIGFSGVVRGTTFEAAPGVDQGSAPFTLTVDWDNGEPETVVDPWVNGDPVTLDGGWDTLGQKGVNITVADADGQEANWAMWVNVVNPISAGITFEDSIGTSYPPNLLSSTQTYRLNANLANVYTGMIDGNPNAITLTWDFGDGSPQSNSENPGHMFPAGTWTVQLLVQQSLLPDRLFTVDVTVT